MAKTTGIRVRHGRGCPAGKDTDARCGCRPSYEASVWSVRDGRKIRRTFTNLNEAKGWRHDAASAVRNGRMRASKPTTVEQEARDWFGRVERGEVRARGGRPFKPSVLRTYRGDLERYVIPQLGTIRLAQLRRREVQELLVDELVSRGLSGSRVHGVLNALRAVLRRPLQHDELQIDPTARLDLPQAGKARERAASPAEAAQLVDALPLDDQALWATAFYAGLRRGELRALRDDDVDLTAGVIHVRRGWDDVEGPIDTKSEKGERVVPIPAVLRRILLEHRARTGRRGADLFFGRTASEPFTPTHMRERAMKAWGATVVGAFFRGEPLPIPLEPIGLHECRHTYVSLMHAAGRTLEEIGDYVGHTSTYMTDRYRHLIEGTRADAAAALDELLAGRAR